MDLLDLLLKLVSALTLLLQGSLQLVKVVTSACCGRCLARWPAHRIILYLRFLILQCGDRNLFIIDLYRISLLIFFILTQDFLDQCLSFSEWQMFIILMSKIDRIVIHTSLLSTSDTHSSCLVARLYRSDSEGTGGVRLIVIYEPILESQLLRGCR